MQNYNAQTFKDLSPKATSSGPSANTQVALFAIFVLTRAIHPTIIDASKSVDEFTGKKSFAYGEMTVVFAETVVSLVAAQLMALGLGGKQAWKDIWRPAPMMVFSCIGVGFAIGDFLEMASMGSLGGAAYQVLLQSKLLITALMMWGIKGTKQSSLQWNILLLVMFSMCVYMIGSSGGGSDSGSIPIMGVVNVLLKVTVSCFCSVLSDKYMKDYQHQPVYIQIAQFKCAWSVTILILSFCDGKTWQAEDGFLTGWDTVTVGVLLSFTIKCWTTMYLLAIFDSVLKNIGEAVSVLVIYFMQVFLPVFEDKFEIPKFLSVMVVILSVIAYVGSKTVVEKARKYDSERLAQQRAGRP